MNYIKLINAFWLIRRERSDFDPYVIALYFALLDIANRRDWKPFTAYREDIITLSGMSAKPYYKARIILKESGLIDFKEGSSKTTMCSYIIKAPLPTVTEATTEGKQYGNTSDYGRETEATTILNKPINYKTSKPINNSNSASLSPELLKEENSEGLTAKPEKPKEKSSAKKEKVSEVDFGSFDTPEFRAKWQEFKQHRKRIKAPILTPESEQRIFNPLTAFDMDFAISLIEATVDSGKWQGLVFKDTSQKYREFLAKKQPTLTIAPKDDNAYRLKREVA